jgi:hypothetical protein
MQMLAFHHPDRRNSLKIGDSEILYESYSMYPSGILFGEVAAQFREKIMKIRKYTFGLGRNNPLDV